MSSTIQQLRQLAPKRALNDQEARSVAERQAIRLLDLLDVREPHVPMTAIADLPRIRVETKRDIPVAGSTHWTGGHWLILVNADDAPTRQRFTIGHELKHVVDHPVVDVAYPRMGDHTSHERQERICDYFAACLLMPRRWLKNYWTAGHQSIDELAYVFGASRAAMRYRLIDIGLLEPTVRRRHYFRRSAVSRQEVLIS